MKKIILILLLCFLLSACSSNKPQIMDNQSTKPSVQINQNTPSVSPTSGPAIESKDNLSVDSQQNRSTSDVETGKNNNAQSEYKKYADYLGINEEVAKFMKDDIDLDGQQEIIIAFGIDWVTPYVLREKNGKLEKIGEIEGNGYARCDVELVKLHNSKNKYICTKLTNGVNLSGFALYQVNGNEIKQIVYSASGTGAGNDYLSDDDKDGLYDGYIQNRYSYDVFYFNVIWSYKWNNNTFELKSTKVDFSEYPDDSESLVDEFIRLNALQMSGSNCTDISNRLKEINRSNKNICFEEPDDNLYYEIRNLRPNLNTVKEDGSTAEVKANLQKRDIVFKVEKSNNRWHITNINQSLVSSSASPQNTEEQKAIELVAQKFKLEYNCKEYVYIDKEHSFAYIVNAKRLKDGLYEVQLHPDYYPLSVMGYYVVDIEAKTVKEKDE
ncbi:MAG TPA: hypothetical protein VF941_01600 [Clostridia bacterium]